MRNINRIYEILDALRQTWEKYPDWRFFQLVCNLQKYVSGDDIGGDCFYVEDDKALEAIKKMFALEEDNSLDVICKKPIPTEMEQLAIDYALACGYHWLAKDKDGSVYTYKKKPYKDTSIEAWGDSANDYTNNIFEIELPISFLSWEDDEPYYIGD